MQDQPTVPNQKQEFQEYLLNFFRYRTAQELQGKKDLYREIHDPNFSLVSVILLVALISLIALNFMKWK